MENEPEELTDIELREQQADKIVNFLTRIAAYEYVQKLLSNPESRNELSFEKFRDFLVRINGIARDIPTNERKIDEKEIIISGGPDTFLMPKFEDKEILLKEAFDSINKINPGDEAYLLPAVVNAVHLFPDGNGRTSRILHTLLKSKSDEEFIENLKLAVGYEGRFETADVSPGIVYMEIEKIIMIKYGIKFEDSKNFSPIMPDGFAGLFAQDEIVKTQKAQRFMYLCHIDMPYCFISASKYLKEKNFFEKVLDKKSYGLIISPNKMEQELSETDWDEIINRYYQLKKEHVEVLIYSFVKPEAYKNLDGSMNLKDFFIKKIQDELKKNQEAEK